jgi:hypothetical protein
MGFQGVGLDWRSTRTFVLLEAAMIRVSVLYPGGDGKKDIRYRVHCDQHIPMVQRLLGADCTA